MKHYCIYFYIGFTLAAFLVSGCVSQKFNLITDTSDIEKSAIHNAIEMFTKTKPKIYKEDSVFHITFTDSIFRLVLREIPPPNKGGNTHEWIRGTYYDNLIAVGILGYSNFKYYLTPSIKVGNKTKAIPTCFIEKDGKLFLWYDDDYLITEELLTVFHKYNLFEDILPLLKELNRPIEDADKFLLVNPIDELKKGAEYFFCKDNLNNYKRIINNKALGYYDIPTIKCK